MPERRRVLIAGAGPTGLALALCLRAYGIELDIVDIKAGPTRDSKATLIDAMSRLQLALIGEDDTIGRDAFFARRIKVGAEDPVEFSDVDTANPEMLVQAQRVTERDLIERLARRETRVHWRRGLGAVRDRGNHVDVELRDAGGRTITRAYDYVVGCEGRRSIVREVIGARLQGEEHRAHIALGDFELTWDEPRDQVHYFVFDDTFFVMIPIAPGRWRVCVKHDGAPLPGRTNPRMITDLVRERLGRDIFAGSPSWSSRVPLATAVADGMSRGRLFIAGDAAHEFSPIDATSMNAGIADALNLGWKLAFDLLGWVHDGARLLDSYAQERLGALRATAAASEAFTRLLLGSRVEGRRDAAGYCGLGVHYDDSTALSDGPDVGRVLTGLPDVLASALLGRHRPTLRVLGFPQAGHFGDARQDLSRLCSSRAVDYLEISPQRPAGAGEAYCEADELPTVAVDDRTWRRLRGRPGRIAVVRPDGFVAMQGTYAEADRVIHFVRSLLGPALAPVRSHDSCLDPARP